MPQIYYGTEIMMRHEGSEHGNIRAEFPGGWEGDAVNAFSGKGLTDGQKDMQKYISTILNWRKNSQVIHTGKLMHFAPQNGIYVYFRYNENETVMVILNKNTEAKKLTTGRFAERMNGFTKGNEIITSAEINQINEINIPASSAMIIELKK